MAQRIRVGRKNFALVDDDDYEALIEYNWILLSCSGGLRYATRKNQAGKRPYAFLMHREIMSVPKGLTVDHIDGNGLNNCKNNLRLATHSEQQWNRQKNSNNTTGYRGVYYDKRNKIYRAEMRAGRVKWSLGTYTNPRDAAIAYNVATLLLKDEHATMNDIDGVYMPFGSKDTPNRDARGKFTREKGRDG